MGAAFVQALRFDVVCTAGLYEIEPKEGSANGRTVAFSTEYREVDSSMGWMTLVETTNVPTTIARLESRNHVMPIRSE